MWLRKLSEYASLRTLLRGEEVRKKAYEGVQGEGALQKAHAPSCSFQTVITWEAPKINNKYIDK